MQLPVRVPVRFRVQAGAEGVDESLWMVVEAGLEGQAMEHSVD